MTVRKKYSKEFKLDAVALVVEQYIFSRGSILVVFNHYF
jgi:transposase-like protein